MSIRNDIPTLTNTGRTYLPNVSNISNIRGVFLTKKTFTFTESDLADESYFLDAFHNLDIVPLHYVLDVVPKNEETFYGESLQDFTYRERTGKYRHALRFNWDLSYHQIVEEYNDSDLYVIYYDSNKNLLATEESTGVYRGFKTNRIVLEKMLAFTNGSDLAWSDLDIELEYAEELTKRGYKCQLNWLPSTIDKLFVSITIEAVGANYLNFIAKYNSDSVLDITKTDVSLLDNNNGELSFSQFNLNGGTYRIQDVTPNLTTGCLIVNSGKYLGRTRYIATEIVEVLNNALFDGLGNNILYEDGNNLIFDN